ncbi:hypothetical protein G7Y89_g11510 [Cudoniella acicularis]|uniref:Uncharacterized protein n=1 Tax=Cudoniella acicularis TaxID=354080 RepID=A0A8H4RDC8_9HELO|nr:hypothetical protein G7Y89_g11510 [Cudoniella acicularis]
MGRRELKKSRLGTAAQVAVPLAWPRYPQFIIPPPPQKSAPQNLRPAVGGLSGSAQDIFSLPGLPSRCDANGTHFCWRRRCGDASMRIATSTQPADKDVDDSHRRRFPSPHLARPPSSPLLPLLPFFLLPFFPSSLCPSWTSARHVGRANCTSEPMPNAKCLVGQIADCRVQTIPHMALVGWPIRRENLIGGPSFHAFGELPRAQEHVVLPPLTILYSDFWESQVKHHTLQYIRDKHDKGDRKTHLDPISCV